MPHRRLARRPQASSSPPPWLQPPALAVTKHTYCITYHHTASANVVWTTWSSSSTWLHATQRRRYSNTYIMRGSLVVSVLDDVAGQLHRPRVPFPRCRGVRLPIQGCRPGFCPPVAPDHLDQSHGLGQPTRPLAPLALIGSQHMDPGRPSLQHIGQNKLFGEVLWLTSAFALVGAPRGSSQNLNVQIAWPNLHTSAPHAPL